MKHKNNCWTRKFLFGLSFLLLLTLQACFPAAGQNQEANPEPTWTPMSLPTDQPYQVTPDNLSYFKETPALIIFGSQDPADNTPLEILNISTEDEYDVSSIPPVSANTWSRPIVAENKDVYFQTGGTLYVLSPGGQIRSVELPYDEENPAYCNWSWKGQLVCLNDVMTTGFLVDQDLNIVEMELPASEAGDSGVYYEPYRVRENGMRIIQITPEISNIRTTVFYKELDLETLTVQSKSIRIDENLLETFHANDSRNEINMMEITRIEGEIDVIGISDSGDKVYLASQVTYFRPYINVNVKTRWWTDVYNGSSMEPLNYYFKIVRNVGKKFVGNYLVTDWLLDPGFGISGQPTVYDLDGREIVFEAPSSLNNIEYVNFILAYADDWVAGDTLGIHYHHNGGGLLYTYLFPDEIVESMGPESYYTISQPIEPK